MHIYTFFLFTGFLVLFFLFTFFFVPETKAKTVDQIYDEINRGSVWRKRPLAYQAFDNPINRNSV